MLLSLFVSEASPARLRGRQRAHRSTAPAFPSVFAYPATPAQLAAITRPAATALANARVVRGKFVQRRYLAGLAKPLESSGSFLFAREAGIEWHTETAVRLAVPADRHPASRNVTRAASRSNIQASDQPALAVVSRVFFALFALDVDSLSHDFELYGQAGDAGWQLGLKPRAEALGSVFRQALVSGGPARSARDARRRQRRPLRDRLPGRDLRHAGPDGRRTPALLMTCRRRHSARDAALWCSRWPESWCSSRLFVLVVLPHLRIETNLLALLPSTAENRVQIDAVKRFADRSSRELVFVVGHGRARPVARTRASRSRMRSRIPARSRASISSSTIAT